MKGLQKQPACPQWRRQGQLHTFMGQYRRELWRKPIRYQDRLELATQIWYGRLWETAVLPQSYSRLFSPQSYSPMF